MPFSSSIARHYDWLASVYESRWPAYNEVQIKWVLDHWPHMDKKAAVLDLGCGTGLALARIREKFPDVDLTGVDVSAGMLKRAKNRLPSATYLEGNIEDSGLVSCLPQGDVVLSLSVLHHLLDADRHLQLLDRLTKPGGTVFLSDFAREGLAMNVGDMIFRWTQPLHKTSWTHSALLHKIENIFPRGIHARAILRPNAFWRIQIFAIWKS